MRDPVVAAEIDYDIACAKADSEHERMLEDGLELCACGCGDYAEPGDMLGWGHGAEDLYIPEHLPQYRVEEIWRCAVSAADRAIKSEGADGLERQAAENEEKPRCCHKN